jgi:alpha-L-arabinofuranosidase
MNRQARETRNARRPAALFTGLFFARANADPGSLNVDLQYPGIKISPTFYGLMTEEIDHSYDGGL